MTNENLLSAFRFHRSRTRAARKWQAPAPNPAWDALNLARRDVAAGTARYSSSPWARGFPPVNSRPDSDGTYFIQDPESVGLRLQYEGRELPGIDHGGWYTNPYGESFRDGSGLCYGAIFLLPGKGGKARAVAGYKHGGGRKAIAWIWGRSTRSRRTICGPNWRPWRAWRAWRTPWRNTRGRLKGSIKPHGRPGRITRIRFPNCRNCGKNCLKYWRPVARPALV